MATPNNNDPTPPPAELPRPRRINDIHHPSTKLAMPGRSMNDIAPVQSRGLPIARRPIPARQDIAIKPIPNLPDAIEEIDVTPDDADRIVLPQKRRSKAKMVLIGSIITVVILLTATLAAVLWYQQQLQPVATDSNNNSRIHLTIEPGSTPTVIAKQLKDHGLIRSQTAFSIYIQLIGARDKLKAGTYNLLPTASTAQIVDNLVSGKQDEFSMTFLPGDTLAAHRKRLIDAGFSATEIDAAFTRTYTGPLFAGKPAGRDMEGYIYGETYRFAAAATVEDIVKRTTDEFEKQVVDNNLVSAYQKQGLTLFQGITLASIIQREVSGASDSKQVAQVFLKRLHEGMQLGSDVTFIYAAKKLGVPATADLDSPYNTRKYVGLPPGPISSPGLVALLAVGAPAPGDYNFFLAGDDGKTYFAHTFEEHTANIKNHCQKLCQ